MKICDVHKQDDSMYCKCGVNSSNIVGLEFSLMGIRLLSYSALNSNIFCAN